MVVFYMCDILYQLDIKLKSCYEIQENRYEIQKNRYEIQKKKNRYEIQKNRYEIQKNRYEIQKKLTLSQERNILILQVTICYAVYSCNRINV